MSFCENQKKINIEENILVLHRKYKVLEKLLQGYNVYVKEDLSGNTQTINEYEHKFNYVRGATLLNTNGEVVEASISIIGKTVKISANVPLDNYKLIIYQ